MLAKGHLSALRPGSRVGASRSRGAAPWLWIVTPCKGRLAFLVQTLARAVDSPEVGCCVVDYSCPDGTADWVEREFDEDVVGGRVVIERVPGEIGFNKCRSHNLGAERAAAAGARYLCFLDADTLVEPGFHEWVRKNAKHDRFLIAGLRDDASDMPSMTGLLVVPTREFQRVGGFDESFAGWGGEDIELRLRLFLLGGLGFAEMPLELARPLPHDNTLRTQFYDEPNIMASNAANMARIKDRLRREWVGRMVNRVEDAERLFYQHRSRRSRAPAEQDV
jgi:GT2 family glycosyltransferase